MPPEIHWGQRGTSTSWQKPHEAQQKQMHSPKQINPTCQDRLVEAGKVLLCRKGPKDSCRHQAAHEPVVLSWQRVTVNWAVLAKADSKWRKGHLSFYSAVVGLQLKYCFQLGLPQYKEITDKLEWIQQHTSEWNQSEQRLEQRLEHDTQGQAEGPESVQHEKRRLDSFTAICKYAMGKCREDSSNMHSKGWKSADTREILIR